MSVNWVDIVIVALVLYEIRDGWERGFATLLAHLGSFLVSLWFAVRFHGPVGLFFVEKFGIGGMWTDVLGYVVVAFTSQIIIEEILMYGMQKLPEKIHVSKTNRWLGSFVSSLNAFVIVAFFLLLALALPLRGTVKQDIQSSTIGRCLVILSERYGGSVQSSLSEIAKKAVTFLTVEPGSNERIPLEIPERYTAVTVDAVSEEQMVSIINQERTDRKLPPLHADSQMTAVARGKSHDMFNRRYFSHYDPDGKNASDRMRDAGVAYTLVGENLAYAPDLTSAHEGLMNSDGHRANILESRFHRIGIGIVDGGIYGKVFTQIFAD